MSFTLTRAVMYKREESDVLETETAAHICNTLFLLSQPRNLIRMVFITSFEIIPLRYFAILNINVDGAIKDYTFLLSVIYLIKKTIRFMRRSS